MRKILKLEGHGLRIGILGVHAISHLWCTNYPGHHRRNGAPSKLTKLAIAAELLANCVCICSYSTAPEILAYLKKLAEKYNLLKYVRLSHRIVGAWWQEETQEWLVKIQRGDNPEDVFEDRCNILVNASGVLKYAPAKVYWHR